MQSVFYGSDTLRATQRRKREQAILSAAQTVFAEVGREQAKIEDIAATAEVSPPTVFNYFGDKDRLFVAAFRQQRLTEHQGRMARIETFEGNTPFELIEAYLSDLMVTDFSERRSRHDERRLWCDFYAASYAGASRFDPDDGMGEVVLAEDRLIAVEIERLLEICVARRLCRLRCSSRDAAELFLSVGNLHWSRWLMGVTGSDELVAETQRQARLFATLLLDTSPDPDGSARHDQPAA